MSTDEINWGPTGALVYERTYSRTKPDGSKETWPETVERVVDGNLSLVPERHHLEGEREQLIRLMTEFKIIPAGRHLWASGVKNAQHLFNCFSADTLVHTEQGVFPINTLAGQTHNVLSEGGVYRPARFDSYGKQSLWCVELSTGEEFLATEDHSWVTYNSGATHRHATKQLAGKKIPYNQAPAPEMGERYWEGVAHGIVYGDGSQSGKSSTMVHLFGEKRELSRFLKDYSRTEIIEHDDRTYVGTLPAHWKSLPSEEVNREYARGFIVGLIASDGYAKNGTVQINTSKDPGAIHRLIISAGLVPGKIGVDREASPYDGSYKPSYRVGIRGWSIKPGRDLLRPSHFLRFGESKEVTGPRTVKVKKVWRTDYFEEVFCAVEPETHTITVGSGVLTGQCWVSGWTEKPSDHFEFTFLRLMEGGGVGSNYSNSFLADYPIVPQDLLVDIVCDPGHPDYEVMKEAGVLSNEYHPDWVGSYQIEDSREGWAAALTDLIDTHYRDEVEHYRRVYDVSRVRPAGSKLRTFGGTASGPLPLARMLKEVNRILASLAYEGQRLTGLDAMEIDHAIAQCVVAGGVRRSARMAMMHWKDPQIGKFMRIKQASGSHWTTNISVEVDRLFWESLSGSEGHMRSHAHEVLTKMTNGMVNNGEPGFWDSSLSNVGEPNEVICTNPCLTGDTVIATIKGPRTFADLAESGEDVEVYSWDPKTKTPVVRWMRRPHKTRENAEILKVTFDSGLVVRCTPDHSFYTFRGKKVQAQDLQPGKSIRAFSASFDGSGHERVHGWDAKRNLANHQYTHRMIWENAHGPIPEGMVIAHLDGNASNNTLENFEMMTPYEHASYDYPMRLDNGFHNRKRETACANHKVVSVEPAGYADVYNGMVEDSHTYIVLDPEPVAGHMSGIVSANCGEIALEPWEPCNLGHVNLAAFVKDNGKVDTLDLIRAHRLMTRFLIRATFSDVADEKSREVLDRNRRIGVGHTGVASFLALTGRKYSEAPKDGRFRDLLREMAREVDYAAENYCHQLRIPTPVKRRTVAPTGTISKMPGVSEGIHPIFSKYFNRRIRFSEVDPEQRAVAMQYGSDGYDVRPDLYAANTVVVTIPTKDSLLEATEAIWGRGGAEEIVESADDLTLNEMLAFQALYQTCWADNAVSFTANIPQGYEAAKVAEQLTKFGGLLKGATLFPEMSMPQAPYERLSKADYEASAVKSVADGVDEACANGGACPIR